MHEAARWSTLDEENQNRTICITELINHGADINALTIQRESPLMSACRYGSRQLVKQLLRYDVDLFHRNIYGYNCLEIAIEENKESIVEHLIDHEDIFALMRNAQFIPLESCPSDSKNNDNNENCCSSCRITANKCSTCSSYYSRLRHDSRKTTTPMRKLIVSMPDMAIKVLDKCVTTVGDKGRKLHAKLFNYEFLEDHFTTLKWRSSKKIKLEYFIHSFSKFCTYIHKRHRALTDEFLFFQGQKKIESNDLVGNSTSDKEINENELYTQKIRTLVTNHPLFLMAIHDRYKLMAHPLSRSLLYHKFFPCSFIVFIIAALFYLTYLVLFTITAMRTRHPQYYYDQTNFSFDSSLCRNVSLALDNIALKQQADRTLRIFMYILFVFLVIKNIWAIIVSILIDWRKAPRLLVEIVALVFSLYFIFDYDYQSEITMRCPIQWQIGACGLFLGYRLVEKF